MLRVVEGLEIGPTIAQGGQGKVKLCRIAGTTEQVAVKIVDGARVPPGTKAHEHLQREIEAMSLISNPNVVSLRRVLWTVSFPNKANTSSREVVMIVMEFVPNGELFGFVAFCGGLPEDMVVAYVRQLMTAVEACHEAGVCHRDLKPENILLAEDYSLKVADFGLSAFLEADPARPGGTTLLSTTCGTKSYKAPEVWSGGLYEGQPVDVWAIGVIAFDLMAGFAPFEKAASSDWYYARIVAHDFSMFWEAHQRNMRANGRREFSADAIAFLSAIFVVDPRHRATLAQLREMAWLRGDHCAPVESVLAEMRRRREDVIPRELASREAARVARRQERHTFHFTPTLFRRACGGSGSGGSDAVGESGGAGEARVPDSPTAPPLPADYPLSTRYTCFYTRESAVAARDAVLSALGDIDEDIKVTVTGGDFKVKVALKDAVELKVCVFKTVAPDGSDVHFVDVVRRGGDESIFRDAWGKLWDAVCDIATTLTPPGDGGAAAAATAES